MGDGGACGTGGSAGLVFSRTPGDYKVTPGERWTVTSRKDGKTVYSGIGPVEVVRSSNVPF
jgi:hypothetical protein